MIYVASSWRNHTQPALIAVLNAAGLEHYDFRNPPNGAGFGWEEVMSGFDRAVQECPANEYLAALEHPRAIEGFTADFAAMEASDTFVLVLPCGKSAHLELGWAVGRGLRTAVLLDGDVVQPELMYRMVDRVSPSVLDLLEWLGVQD